VNPYNVDLVAESLHQALVMDPSERTARMRALQQRERRRDVHAWLDAFLEAASRPPHRFRPVGEDDLATWLGDYARGFELALFLDYDGTLAPIVDHPSEARVPAAVRALLAQCADRPDTDVAIVSGRSLADLRSHVNGGNLVLAGNHGLELEGPGLDRFSHPDLPHFETRSRALGEALGEIREPGVWVEEKGASLTLHYRQADPASHARISERARAAVQAAGYQVRDAHCAVEARPPIGWDKGRAIMHVLRARHGPAWSEHVRAVYVGDDDTDEDAFRALQGLGVTFRVGRAERPTLASYRLPNVEAVEALLRWIAERPLVGGHPGRLAAAAREADASAH
jgi:trehalose-phosphatase